jgi:hypothetical protein
VPYGSGKYQKTFACGKYFFVAFICKNKFLPNYCFAMIWILIRSKHQKDSLLDKMGFFADPRKRTSFLPDYCFAMIWVVGVANIKKPLPAANIFFVAFICKNKFLPFGHKKTLHFVKGFLLFVGVARFELTTSTSQMWRDTGLRYTPNSKIF